MLVKRVASRCTVPNENACPDPSESSDVAMLEDLSMSLVVKKKRRLLLIFGALAGVVSIYPLFVLLYTWSCVFRSDLEGGGNGPLDAYRHALASAVVSYTLGERVVGVVTRVMESKGKDSNKMDRHNNRIGAQIGARSKSFWELEPAVRERVLDGVVDSSNENQITWLSKERWRRGGLW